MALPQLFSRRKRAVSNVVTDVYVYDEMPKKIRIQIVQIIQEGLGCYEEYSRNVGYWTFLVEQMRKEKGVFSLTDKYDDYGEEFCNWLLNEREIPTFLDGVELAFRAIKDYVGEYESHKTQRYVDEMNARMQEAGIGYEFQSDNIIQIDKQIIHNDVVLPALKLLHEPKFAGANDEYLGAHQFFRSGDYESCIIECCKAYESVLKVIGTKRNWAISLNDPASKLLAAAYSSGFIPQYMQTQFGALRAILESGVPTIRNRMAGHGSGGQVRRVDRHLAAYQLHQTAAAIVFLVEHDKATP